MCPICERDDAVIDNYCHNCSQDLRDYVPTLMRNNPPESIVPRSLIEKMDKKLEDIFKDKPVPKPILGDPRAIIRIQIE